MINFKFCSRLKKFQIIFQTCGYQTFNKTIFNNTFLDSDYLKTLFEVIYTNDEMFQFCKCNNFDDSCKTLFGPMVTEYGVCHTFNALPGKDIYRSEV